VFTPPDFEGLSASCFHFVLLFCCFVVLYCYFVVVRINLADDIACSTPSLYPRAYSVAALRYDTLLFAQSFILLSVSRAEVMSLSDMFLMNYSFFA
jgi:hypothetical protein